MYNNNNNSRSSSNKNNNNTCKQGKFTKPLLTGRSTAKNSVASNSNNCNDVNQKKVTDVDAEDEDVYELVYGVGTCGYLQQVTRRA